MKHIEDRFGFCRDCDPEQYNKPHPVLTHIIEQAQQSAAVTRAELVLAELGEGWRPLVSNFNWVRLTHPEHHCRASIEEHKTVVIIGPTIEHTDDAEADSNAIVQAVRGAMS